MNTPAALCATPSRGHFLRPGKAGSAETWVEDTPHVSCL